MLFTELGLTAQVDENTSIDVLRLKNRTANALHGADLHTFGDLRQFNNTEELMLFVGSFGVTSLGDLESGLKLYFKDNANISAEADAILYDADLEKDIIAYPYDFKGMRDVLIHRLHPATKNHRCNIKFVNKNGDYIVDTSIDSIKFSNRTMNVLVQHHIEDIMDILDIPYDEFSHWRQFGESSQNEVIFWLKTHMVVVLPTKNSLIDNAIYMRSKWLIQQFPAFELNSVVKALGSMNDSLKDVPMGTYILSDDDLSAKFYSTKEVWDDLSKYIVSQIEIDGPLSKVQIMKRLHGYFKTEFQLDNLLRCMQSNNQIEYFLGKYQNKYIRLMDALSFVSERNRDIFILRLQGNTLEQVGSRHSMTRERVRQIISQELEKLPVVYEDNYRRLFETYDMSLNLFCHVFQESEECYRYLQCKYEQGTQSAGIMVWGENLSDEQRKRIKSYIGDGFILVEEGMIPFTVDEIIKYLMKKYHKDEPCDVDVIRDEFCKFCEDRNFKELLKFTESTRAFSARLTKRDCSYVLTSYHSMVRYYDWKGQDFSDLVSQIDFTPFKDKIISAHKIYDTYPVLMKKYDLKNPYELHNLLRHFSDQFGMKVEFSRMPLIFVGDCDREKQVVDLLNSVAPISRKDFMDLFEKQFGIDKVIFGANWTQYIADRFSSGVYY